MKRKYENGSSEAVLESLNAARRFESSVFLSLARAMEQNQQIHAGSVSPLDDASLAQKYGALNIALDFFQCSGCVNIEAMAALIIDRAIVCLNRQEELLEQRLRQNCPGSIVKTRRECCEILAGGFMCTFPPTQHDGLMPDFRFVMLWNVWKKTYCGVEYLKCMLAYFSQLLLEDHHDECIVFKRKVLHGLPSSSEEEFWMSNTAPLLPLSIEDSSRIEDAHDALQMDFANCILGGMVLSGYGSQEENRFITSPELIVSMLFCERLLDHEVVEITGATQFAEYTIDTSRNFKFMGYYRYTKVPEKCTLTHCRKVSVVAFDALSFNRYGKYKPGHQYQKEPILRELKKCYVAFKTDSGLTDGSISTGNWGSGCFRGDVQLKFLIQWIAASAAGCSKMTYCAFGEQKITGTWQDLSPCIGRVTVATLTRALMDPSFSKTDNVFAFVKKALYNGF